MSELLNSVKGIERIPLFPLPLVVMPFEILPLHIFEERYREMLADVQAGNNMFGIHRFEPENEFQQLPKLGTIGCIAAVREAQTMDDGRSNILTNGVIRYRLKSIVESPSLYTVGEVEFFEDDPEDESEKLKIADEVFEIFTRIAKAAFKMSGNRGQLPEIERAAPEAMSFLVAAAFSLENDKKYELLEMTSTIERLDLLHKLLKGAADQMESSADIQELSRTNGHSKKHLDI
jgi:Lon protease-like protein